MNIPNQNATPETQNAEPQTQQQPQSQQPTPAPETQETPAPDAQQANSEPQPEISYSDLMKQVADLKAERNNLKNYVDKYTSEIGNLKKQIRATMTETEAQAQEKLEAEKAKDERLAQLERNEKVRNAVERYMSLGLKKDSAKTLAESELDNDMDTVTAALDTHIKAIIKATEERVRADLLSKMPAPVSGNGDGQVDYQKQAADALASGDTQGYIMAQLMSAQEANN